MYKISIIYTILFFSIAIKVQGQKDFCTELFEKSAEQIPELYQSQNYAAIDEMISKRKIQCGNSEDLFCLQTLLSIQTNHFNKKDLPDTSFYKFLNSLDLYTSEYPDCSYMSTKYYNARPYSIIIFKLIRTWANQLINSQNLSSTELFLCELFSGSLSNPVKHIEMEKGKYPYLDSLILRSYQIQRNVSNGVMGFKIGSWVPFGSLNILGSHPSFSLEIGHRRNTNELDIDLTLRFINSKHPYEVYRSDSVYSRTNYRGYFIGISYTHYFIKTLKFESGLTFGSGYDGFDIVFVKKNDKSFDYLKPFSIGSLNINSGIRMNFFPNPNLFIGLEAKYNKINYRNKGGTNLQGNAFTTDLSIGGNF